MIYYEKIRPSITLGVGSTYFLEKPINLASNFSSSFYGVYTLESIKPLSNEKVVKLLNLFS